MSILSPKRECSIRKVTNGYIVTAEKEEFIFAQFYEASEWLNDYLDPAGPIEEYQTTVNQIKVDIDRSV